MPDEYAKAKRHETSAKPDPQALEGADDISESDLEKVAGGVEATTLPDTTTVGLASNVPALYEASMAAKCTQAIEGSGCKV